MHKKVGYTTVMSAAVETPAAIAEILVKQRNSLRKKFAVNA